jgi:gamma-glutamylcyclotransferase (GGCT)/AIG2-like uncharacterized protein YtfP
MPLYFAYGSNMDRAGMASRCPRAQALGVARLEQHRFLFARGGYCAIEPRRGATVYGVLWRVSARDVAVLDAYENVPGGLYRRVMRPVRRNGKALRAFVYIMRHPRLGRAPSDYQQSSVLRAARDWGFPNAYLDELAGWAGGWARTG